MRDKFRELILYVARETEDDPTCGASKLNKILFYADFLVYRELGSSLSGQTFLELIQPRIAAEQARVLQEVREIPFKIQKAQDMPRPLHNRPAASG